MNLILCLSAYICMQVHDPKKPGPGYVPHVKGGYKCLTCGLKLTNRSNAGEHIKTHSSRKPYKCASCPAKFKTRGCLNQHESTQHEPPAHCCPKCGRVFNYKYCLLQHLATHLNEDSARRGKLQVPNLQNEAGQSRKRKAHSSHK